MILTTRNLPTYLLSKGLISYESVVDGDLTITDASHRNRAFRVLRGGQPGYFVKQVRPGDAASISTWEQEDACYRRLSPSVILPEHKSSDFESRVLVLELVPQSETLSEYHRRLGSCPIAAATGQANALSIFHRTTQDAQEPGKPPWILSVHETNPAWFDSLSPANAQLLDVVQGYPEFGELLSGLRLEWQPSCLIHGDVKWDNFLIQDNESGVPRVMLIDLEMAGFGDPCWDLGSVFQAYLNHWIYSMPFQQSMRADLLVTHARHPIEQLQPAIRAFWSTYMDATGADASAARLMLSRSVRFGAARMIQTAYEMMQGSNELQPTGVAMLQTSFNILTRPADAIRELLGFSYE